MNFIPNIREKIVSTSEGKKLNEYYQGNLARENQYLLKGYDTSVDEIENFYNNMSLYENELKTALGKETLDINLAEINSNCEYTDDDWKKLSEETKLLITMKRCMYNWLELSRNELGISLMAAKPKSTNK